MWRISQIIMFAFLCAAAGRAQETIANAKGNLMHGFTLEEFISVATGCHQVSLIDGTYHFRRFPVEVLEFFSPIPSRFVRAEATSGIRLRFRSDTRVLIVSGNIKEKSPQTEPFILLCNDSVLAELPLRGTSGDFEQKFIFQGNQEKIIEICFPAYCAGTIRKLMTEENATVVPLKRKGIYYAMGNSITQQGGRYKGYADIVARGLDLGLHDAGVGGHIFEAGSLPFAYVDNPDLITIAYGTNDWSGSRPVENARSFLDRLTSLYPETPVYLLEPLRRYVPLSETGKLARNKSGYSLQYYRRKYRRIAREFPTVTVISYKKLMPDEPELFADGVHPSDKGHELYGKNLLRLLLKLHLGRRPGSDRLNN